MNTFYRITIAIRLIFVLFAIAAYAIPITPFYKAYIIGDIYHERVSGEDETYHYRMVLTTSGKKFSFDEYDSRGAFSRGDTIIAEENILTKPISVYKWNNQHTCPLSGPVQLFPYFLIVGIFSLGSVILGRRSRFERWESTVMALCVMDIGLLISYYLA